MFVWRQLKKKPPICCLLFVSISMALYFVSLFNEQYKNCFRGPPDAAPATFAPNAVVFVSLPRTPRANILSNTSMRIAAMSLIDTTWYETETHEWPQKPSRWLGNSDGSWIMADWRPPGCGGTDTPWRADMVRSGSMRCRLVAISHRGCAHNLRDLDRWGTVL